MKRKHIGIQVTYDQFSHICVKLGRVPTKRDEIML